jgi:hypothetical protein
MHLHNISHTSLIRHLRTLDYLQSSQLLFSFLMLGGAIPLTTLGILSGLDATYWVGELMLVPCLGCALVWRLEKQRQIEQLRGLGLGSEIIV